MRIKLKNKQLCRGLYNFAACISGIVLLSSCAKECVIRQEPPPPAPVPVDNSYKIGTTAFNVSINGFQFANTAPIPDKRILNTDDKIKIFKTTKGMGYCGGMCLSAMDLFCGGYQVPEVKEIGEFFKEPSAFEEFWKYVVKRQGYFATAVKNQNEEWTGMDDLTISEKTRDQFKTLRSMLDSGQPVPLVLINTGIQANHVVLAVGYVYYYVSEDTTIYIYDPNFRKQEQYLIFNPKRSDPEIKLTLNGLRVRGFFIYYDKRDPDAKLPTEELGQTSGRNNACPEQADRRIHH